MPTRPVVAMIVLFWLGTLGYILYVDLWPRLFGYSPPPLYIDLTDEATQVSPTNWIIYRGDAKVGTLTTRMRYVNQDDSFQFTNSYRDLVVDIGRVQLFSLVVHVPTLDTVIRVSREGELLEQTMNGNLQAKIQNQVMAEARVDLTSEVRNGILVGRCQLVSSLGRFDEVLTPVPVPSGQVMNPLMPVNRLRDVQPGRTWIVQEVDPLRDSIEILFRQIAKKSEIASSLIPTSEQRQLQASVRSRPVRLFPDDANSPLCWVIDYKTDELEAATWVHVGDGRVMRQTASGMGESLRFERDD